MYNIHPVSKNKRIRSTGPATQKVRAAGDAQGYTPGADHIDNVDQICQIDYFHLMVYISQVR